MFEKKLIYSKEQIADRVNQLGQQISQDYKKLLKEDESLLVVGVLNGAFIFMSDLIRAIDLPVEVDFIRLSSYQNQNVSTSKVMMTKNIEKDLIGRHILVVEDIADCGLTLAWLLEFLSKRNPASIKVAVAVDKEARREKPVKIDYRAFQLDDGFLVGYGLDYAEYGRNLPDIYHLTFN